MRESTETAPRAAARAGRDTSQSMFCHRQHSLGTGTLAVPPPLGTEAHTSVQCFGTTLAFSSFQSFGIPGLGRKLSLDEELNKNYRNSWMSSFFRNWRNLRNKNTACVVPSFVFAKHTGICALRGTALRARAASFCFPSVCHYVEREGVRRFASGRIESSPRLLSVGNWGISRTLVRAKGKELECRRKGEIQQVERDWTHSAYWQTSGVQNTYAGSALRGLARVRASVFYSVFFYGFPIRQLKKSWKLRIYCYLTRNFEFRERKGSSVWMMKFTEITEIWRVFLSRP